MATPMLVGSLNQMGRTMRRPQHRFQLRTRPWQLQPFFIAPVLPGETMKSLLLQARCVTDPIANKLVGWWNEYYVFYVKHRDMANSVTHQSMMLDPNQAASANGAYSAGATVQRFKYANSIDWVKECSDAVVKFYFRQQSDTAAAFQIGGVDIASINQESWLNSTEKTSDITAIDVDLDAIGAGAPLLASEAEKGLRMYQLLRTAKLTDMSYDDFLATYGVRTTVDREFQPELVRYVRDWTYPSNTVEPTTGVPSSACSWAVAEKADKDRFFKEPGFLFGITCCRPKVYLSLQTGAAVGLLNTAMTWLPAVMRDDPNTSVINVTLGTGPLSTSSVDYTVDIRDLFMYGDQFLNYTIDVSSSRAALPVIGTHEERFPSSTDADGLFVAASPSNQVRQDGVVSLAIAGTVQDYNPQSARSE